MSKRISSKRPSNSGSKDIKTGNSGSIEADIKMTSVLDEIWIEIRHQNGQLWIDWSWYQEERNVSKLKPKNFYFYVYLYLYYYLQYTYTFRAGVRFSTRQHDRLIRLISCAGWSRATSGTNSSIGGSIWQLWSIASNRATRMADNIALEWRHDVAVLDNNVSKLIHILIYLYVLILILFEQEWWSRSDFLHDNKWLIPELVRRQEL